MIIITAKSDKEKRSITGTLFGTKFLRIVKLDNMFIHIIPEGNIIIMENYDRPGVIGAVGSLLGKHNINIAHYQLGREEKNGKAISAVTVDQDIDEKILEMLKKIKNVTDARLVRM